MSWEQAQRQALDCALGLKKTLGLLSLVWALQLLFQELEWAQKRHLPLELAREQNNLDRSGLGSFTFRNFTLCDHNRFGRQDLQQIQKRPLQPLKRAASMAVRAGIDNSPENVSVDMTEPVETVSEGMT